MSKKGKTKPTKDRWFSISGIIKEAKRVRWAKWKSEPNNPGTFQNTVEVVIFTAFFALFFVACDFGISYLLRVLGIGA